MPPCNWKCWLMGFIVGLILALIYCNWTGSPGGQNPKPAPLGMVWNDNAPQNCARESTETGIGNITVELRDLSNNLVSTAVTDANGYYAFNGNSFSPGSYNVVIPSAPGSPTCDSDSDPGPGDGTVGVTVPAPSAGAAWPVAEFGYQ